MRPNPFNRRFALAAFALLLLVVPVVAQVFLPARRAIGAPDSYYNPTNWLPTPEYWWNATDLSASPVETWTDRVKGRNMKQTLAVNKPKLSTNGVYFDGVDDYLVVTNVLQADLVSGSALGSWLFVLGMVDPGRSIPQLIMGTAPSGSDFFVFAKTNWLGDSSGSPAADDIGPISTNFFYLFLTTSNLASTAYGYTNGSLAYSPSTWNSGGNPIRVGITTTNDPFGNLWTYAGYIQEIIGWTNIAFSESQLSNVNKYATSVWSIGSPAVVLPPDEPLVVHYEFNEGSGSTTADSSGNGYTGNITGATWITGKSGSGFALQFDGVDDFLETASSVTYGVSKITVCAWVWEITAPSSKNLYSSRSAVHPFFGSFDNGIIQDASIWNSTAFANGRIETSATGSTGEWFHWAIVYDNSTAAGDMKFYYNGGLVGTSVTLNNKSTSGNFGATVLYLCQSGAGGFFGNAKVDDFRIYSRELTAAEIIAVMNDPQ